MTVNNQGPTAQAIRLVHTVTLAGLTNNLEHYDAKQLDVIADSCFDTWKYASRNLLVMGMLGVIAATLGVLCLVAAAYKPDDSIMLIITASITGFALSRVVMPVRKLFRMRSVALTLNTAISMVREHRSSGEAKDGDTT